MQADSANLDHGLIEFLKRFFPAEVKAKQKQNERDAAADRFGSGQNMTCVIM